MEETENTAENQVSQKRKFTAGHFEGPLDLLWSLIRENKINVYDIPIAEITDQFLDYLDYAVELNLQDLSEFYVWAAKLVCIKSRMLLPVEVSYDDDESMEDPREELVETLIEYQRFKKLSSLMEEQEEQSEWSFERKKIERFLPFENDENQWEKMDPWALLQDMQKIFRNLTNVNPDERILNMNEDITTNEKIALMNELLEKNGECMFTDLITRRGNELDVICAFMALLEAVKNKLAEIYQNRMFGDIKICRKNKAA
ncbi:MAG TPA: segregation/condensation protein A [Treponema sp.]|jgi:segregation and condensation protein A|nr:segregation/condensation protein A [Treponema sp.]HBB42376.1 segregation/condensation protein A [Treponema sp.]HCA20644.1 segregation/condensation protein A [Treponema sp.]